MSTPHNDECYSFGFGGFVIGLIIGLLFSWLLVVQGCNSYWEKEAVIKGHATYSIDPTGSPKWEWLPPCKKIER